MKKVKEIIMANAQALSASFMKNLITLAAIIGGAFWIVHEVSDMMDEKLKPVVRMLEAHETKISGLHDQLAANISSVKLNEYRISVNEARLAAVSFAGKAIIPVPPRAPDKPEDD